MFRTWNELGVKHQAPDGNPLPALPDQCPTIGPQPNRRLMIVVCAWCSKQLTNREGSGISHGICPDCAVALLAESDLPS